MKQRTILVLGFEVEVYLFGKRTFLYPSFNRNAEFRGDKKGFKALYQFLRNVRWMRQLFN